MSLIDHIAGWQPPVQTRSEQITPGPASSLAALLDQSWPARLERELPPLWHWLYFLDHPPEAELGADGHPRNGEFLPPIPSRRRMFAGGRLTFFDPIVVGEKVTKTSKLHDAVVKQGSKSELLFVTVRHELSVDGEVRLMEESDLVYRSEDTPPVAHTDQFVPSESAPWSDAPWQLELTADPVLLFRFSALTANAHRIHYDEPYTRLLEGFPSLVVHGPLLALLLLELPRRFAAQRTVESFEFRARRPVFAGQAMLVHGSPGPEDTWDLGVNTTSTAGAMTGTVRLR
ncbi:MaoC family dehydratase N-terminal domain-containing protein [Nocardia sp. NPDC059239]|uniref:FAS1-like dehydratase domain-containing protein n=1 Tax=unclassified Nocardia TaxID=2637762 RepID=UPI00368FC988